MCDCSGKQRYISLEKMFEYEHTSKFNVSAETRGLLVKEIEGDEFHLSPIQDKILLNDAESILLKCHGMNITEIENEFLRFSEIVPEKIIHEMFSEISDFIFTDPQIPDSNKNYIGNIVPHISVEHSRDKITDAIIKMAGKSELCTLTLYVYRSMDKIDWLPFVKAAIERNPVCFTDLNGRNISEVYEILKEMPDESIYDEKRLALPDEVWNFKRGDGIEKALLLADFIIKKDNLSSISIEIENNKVTLTNNGNIFHFTSHKSFRKSIRISDKNYIIN